jgi:hypothetical protein
MVRVSFPKMKSGDVVAYVSPFRAGTFAARIISINDDGELDVLIRGMGDAGRRRFANDRPIRLRGVSAARLMARHQRGAA